MKIKFIDNMIADNSNLYIWSNDESIDKKKLLSKLKRIGITDVYCKELSLKDVECRNDFVSAWFHERYVPEMFVLENDNIVINIIK